MTPRQAEEYAHNLWGTSDHNKIGRAVRRRKDPRFTVGYIDVAAGRFTALGSSNVDWESAFWIAGVL